MKLVLINGSPRGKASNTKLLLDRFLDGFRSVDKEIRVEEFYLKTEKDLSRPTSALLTADIALIAFPLYTDSMPGIVKEFIEELDPINVQYSHLKLGFLVQSGFPEAHHSTFVEKYLEKLAVRLGVRYLGTLIRGGVEGIQIQPVWMTRYLDLFFEQGQYLALEWEFSEEISQKIKNPNRLKGLRLLMFKILRLTGLSNFYWNLQLKQNKVHALRFAKPYASTK